MQRGAKASALAWDDVRLFLALTRARTVAAAARSLGIDASTVSRRLTTLEDALGTTLFVRGRDGLGPTQAAEELLPAAEMVEQGVARFTRTVEALERDVSGLVRLTCPVDLAEVVVAPTLRRLHEQHPGLRFTVDSSEALLDLTRREADIALRVVKPVRGDLVRTQALRASWVAAGAPALVHTLGSLARWEDAPWIGWGERYASLPAAQWLARHAPTVEPIVRSDSLGTQLAAVRAGLGIALVPRGNIAHYGLAPVTFADALRPDTTTWPTDELYLVTHEALRDVPRIRVVWDALLEALAALT